VPAHRQRDPARKAGNSCIGSPGQRSWRKKTNSSDSSDSAEENGLDGEFQAGSLLEVQQFLP